MKNQTIIEERNRTANTPNVTVTFPNGGEFFNNDIINIIWNANDADDDTLFYAVLLSTDNGADYNTIIFDHNTTSFNVSSNDLSDCTLCRIKVLATDGVNTNESKIKIYVFY